MSDDKTKVCESVTSFLAALTCAKYALHQTLTEANGNLSQDTIEQIYEALTKCDSARRLALLDMKNALTGKK